MAITSGELIAQNLARTGGVDAQLQMGRDKISRDQMAQDYYLRQQQLNQAIELQRMRDAMDRQKMQQSQSQFESTMDYNREGRDVQQNQWQAQQALKEQAAAREAEEYNRNLELQQQTGRLYSQLSPEEQKGTVMESPIMQAAVRAGMSPENLAMLANDQHKRMMDREKAAGTGGSGTEYQNIMDEYLQLMQIPEAERTPLEQRQFELYEDRLELKSTGGKTAETIAEQELAKTKAKGAGKFHQDLQESLTTIDTTMAQLELLENAVENIRYSGFGGKFLPAMSTEAMQLESEGTKEALKAVQQTKGAVSDREMALFMGTALGRDKTRTFNRNYITAAKGILLRKGQQAQFFDEWNKLYGTVDGAYKAFQKYADDNPLFEIKGNKISLYQTPEQLMNDYDWYEYLNEGVSGGKRPQVRQTPSAGTNFNGWGIKRID